MPDLSKLIRQRKRRKSVPIRRTQHAELGDEACHQVGWRDVEGGIPGLGARSRDCHTSRVGDLLGIAFFDGDRVPIDRRSIDQSR